MEKHLTRRELLSLMLVSAIQPAAGAEPGVPAAAMKTLGVIGGTSWHSTVEYYRYINEAINEYYGNETNPPLIIYNLNQRLIHGLQAAGRWNRIAGIYSDAGIRLKAAGAQGVLFAANTAHRVYRQVAQTTGIPLLHIADATAAAIRHANLRSVGLLGTRYTMEDGFIREWLKQHYGIEVVVPASQAVRDELQRVITRELGMGVFRPESKRYVLAQIEDLREHGAQGIILGCTEFTLIISQADVPIPAFDTTRLHAQMAVDFILGRLRGGAAS